MKIVHVFTHKNEIGCTIECKKRARHVPLQQKLWALGPPCPLQGQEGTQVPRQVPPAGPQDREPTRPAQFRRQRASCLFRLRLQFLYIPQEQKSHKLGYAVTGNMTTFRSWMRSGISFKVTPISTFRESLSLLFLPVAPFPLCMMYSRPLVQLYNWTKLKC